MNRPLIITIGATILLLVIGLWVYLLLYGTPTESREVFTNLGFLSPTEIEGEIRTIDPAPQNNGVQLALGGAELQQLTTRAVAGFGFASSTGKIVRYVERGTGHVYEIDLISGMETQISVTTFPQTLSAVFSPHASTVALISEEIYSSETIVGTFTDDASLKTYSLPRNTENVAFETESVVYFSLEEGAQTVGYSFDLDTQTRSEVFRIDLLDLAIVWGATVDGVYAYPKSTQYLEGYLYKVAGNTLSPVTPGGYGLAALVRDSTVITSTIQAGLYISKLDEAQQGLLLIEEKCTFDPLNINQVWCAAPLEVPKAAYLEEWYKGAIISEDYLWLSDLNDRTSHLIGDLSALSGRTIDIADITIDAHGELLLFSNKLDGALWLYKVIE